MRDAMQSREPADSIRSDFWLVLGGCGAPEPFAVSVSPNEVGSLYTADEHVLGVELIPSGSQGNDLQILVRPELAAPLRLKPYPVRHRNVLRCRNACRTSLRAVAASLFQSVASRRHRARSEESMSALGSRGGVRKAGCEKSNRSNGGRSLASRPLSAGRSKRACTSLSTDVWL